MSRKVDNSVPPERLKWAFHKFEKSGTPAGNLYIRDLLSILTEFGDKDKRLSKEDATSLIRQVS
jgi:Ca2+-binding EF-hand superfamily protein